MSFSINRAILLGNVTRDPELRMTTSGRAVLTINLATNHSVKQGDGSYTDIPTFHRVVVWGKIAEWLSKNISKGSKLYVDGRISSREYTDKSGQKQRSREIIAENVIPMSIQQARQVSQNTQKTTQDDLGKDFPDRPTNDTTQTGQEEKNNNPEANNNENISPDDIPF